MFNGVNYWEEDPVTGKAQGLTEVLAAKVVPNADGSARIEMELSYHPPGAAPVLKESRLIEVSAPDERGGYRIDWRGTFTAGEKDVLLQGGTAGGGYAGLSVRISQASGDWVLVNSEGRRDVPPTPSPATRRPGRKHPRPAGPLGRFLAGGRRRLRPAESPSSIIPPTLAIPRSGTTSWTRRPLRLLQPGHAVERALYASRRQSSRCATVSSSIPAEPTKKLKSNGRPSPRENERNPAYGH